MPAVGGIATTTGPNSLIFAEDEAIRQIFADALNARNHKVQICASSRKALRVLSGSRVDLLIIQWPALSGVGTEVCRHVGAAGTGRSPLILAVVDPADSNQAAEAIAAGAHDVATWPAARHLLDARLRIMETRLQAHSEAEQAESSRRAAEDRFSLTAAGAADGLWNWDLAANLVEFSERWKEILGYGEVEIGHDPAEWLSRIHPEDSRLVRERLDGHLRGRTPIFEAEHRLRRKDDSYRWVVARGVAARSAGAKAHRIAGSLTDVSARKAAEEQLLHDVSHDPLTGLPNRARFMDRLQRVFERAKRHSGSSFAVVFLDVDRFKLVNDGLGHIAGDHLLVAIAHRLEESLRPVDTVARLGGDEFAILLDDVQEPREATLVAERIQKALHLPFEVGGQEVYATVSTGIAQHGPTYQKAEDLLRDADTAMYRAKAMGRDRYAVFDRGMHEKAVAALQLENDLRRALDTKAFIVHYQPIIALVDGRIVGFEALVRWQHPRRGLVLPGDFVHVAEETGLIIPIDRWVAGEACRQLRAWQVQFRHNPPLTMSINVSGAQFMQPDLPMQIDRILRENGLWGSTLKLEITESVIMEKARYTGPMLEHLRDLSIKLSIDDFGTGYSSLSYLRRFEIDTLKIDSSFVSKITHDDESSEIVRTIITLAHNLGKDMIAEGVETASQLAKLYEMDCSFAQGYYFSRPLGADAATKLLATDPRWPPAPAARRD
jgi:diguanylate cyclase (GGDEF)-like protein/PAS domain S-box-containing protein